MMNMLCLFLCVLLWWLECSDVIFKSAVSPASGVHTILLQWCDSTHTVGHSKSDTTYITEHVWYSSHVTVNALGQNFSLN